MLFWLRKNSFVFAVVWLACLCTLLAEAAKADVKGIPYTDKFQAASYPYARVVPGCTAARLPAGAGETWGDVSFAGACSALDRCFHTVGAGWADCNEKYRMDLKLSCSRDLERGRLQKNQRGRPDEQALHLCLQIAELFAAKAEEPAAEKRFDVSQKLEADYLAYVRSVVNDTYKTLLRRNATRQEATRALATLTADYSMDDLKAALMGTRLQAEADAGSEDVVLADYPME